MTDQTPKGIAIANAMTAIDQAAEYETLDDALVSYAQNAFDTLHEEGFKSDADWDRCADAFREYAHAHGAPGFNYC